jgi:phage terminase large subunit GpA-like protein
MEEEAVWLRVSIQNASTKNDGSKWEWEKIYRDNHALDARLYAIAAACVVGLDRFQSAHWNKLKHESGANLTAFLARTRSLIGPFSSQEKKPRRTLEPRSVLESKGFCV